MTIITQKELVEGFKKLPTLSRQELFDFMQFLLLKDQILENNGESLTLNDLNTIAEGEREYERGETTSLEDYAKSRGITI